MNSNLAKLIAARYLIYEKNYIGAITEYCNCDVVGIKRSLYASEIEVKLTKSDLMKELRIIKSILKGDHPIKGVHNKIWKHQSFLKQWKREWNFMPNEFSFIVPKDLKDLLFSEIGYLADLPYGIYYFEYQKYEKSMMSYYDIKEPGRWDVHCLKEPEKIHKIKIKPDLFLELFRKISTENNSLREKLYWIPGGENE